MRKTIILTTFIFSIMMCSNIFGQQEAPAGAGDKNLRDNNVKMRSVDLERTERDAKKSPTETSATAGNETEDQLAARFDQIKNDYEQIQLSQDMVIKTYQTGSTINYAQIGKSAAEVSVSAKRLKLNLFPTETKLTVESDKPEKKEKNSEQKTAKSIPNLIVELDNAIGSFATSPMFQNLRVIDPVVGEKAKADLQNIIDLSAELSNESQKKSSASGK